ncbi:probable plastid-lipid-associated protein 12, chloroplastic isoform X2 [Magnolia sinica]|uniref:probable plastid-lipid-associated protein 12, chloroplastic isoform X2 n=1 Tax=Magnolia sinica TaxID=86752 RepID=UPI002657F2D0|nr:probable plastid-lipid-associated protein 12, chloroplastic isoform X2 [Magnolia sinica]
MAVEIAKLGLRSTPFSPPNRSKFPKIFESCRTEKPFTVRLSSSSSSSFIDEQQISFSEPEKVLLERLLGIQGRGRKASPEQLKDVESAVKTLEDLKGVPDPTSSTLIEGRWQLIFTTRPGTASPIQRTFVGVDFFKIFQEVYLRTDDPRVSNIVKLSDAIGELKVEAAATVKDEKRILFRFDKAAFSFKFLPFKVPYPVPFRLLGDEAKGWLDTTYLSHTGNIRISRGNKGTTFVLQKKTEPRQRLLSSISTGIGVKEAIDELISLNPIRAKGEPEALVGEWQLLWSSQSEAESLLDVAANGLEGLQNFGNYGQVEHLIDVLPGFGLRAIGNFVVSENNTYIVTMAETAFLIGGKFLLPVEVSGKFNLELLYIDNKIRITRGYRRITFVHLRVSEPTKM